VAFHAGRNRLIAVAGRYDEHFPASLLAGFTCCRTCGNQCEVKTQIELVSEDTSPLIFTARIRSASFPEKPLQRLVELAEGIEPPTL
jgi:hypothetical protein